MPAAARRRLHERPTAVLLCMQLRSNTHARGSMNTAVLLKHQKLQHFFNSYTSLALASVLWKTMEEDTGGEKTMESSQSEPGEAAPPLEAAPAEDPLLENLLANAPPEKKDRLVSKLKERLAVLDACAAVDLTEPEKKEVKAKNKKARGKSKKDEEKKEGKEDKENAAEALAAQHREDFEKLKARLEEEKAAFEQDMTDLKSKQREEEEKANADCSSRIKALNEESARLRALYCPK